MSDKLSNIVVKTLVDIVSMVFCPTKQRQNSHCYTIQVINHNSYSHRKKYE